MNKLIDARDTLYEIYDTPGVPAVITQIDNLIAKETNRLKWFKLVFRTQDETINRYKEYREIYDPSRRTNQLQSIEDEICIIRDMYRKGISSHICIAARLASVFNAVENIFFVYNSEKLNPPSWFLEKYSQSTPRTRTHSTPSSSSCVSKDAKDSSATCMSKDAKEYKDEVVD